MSDDIEAIDADNNEQEELYEHHRIIVDKGQTPLRIDKFLFNRLQNVSRNRVQNAAEAGSILVNGKEVKSSYKIKPLDLITIVLAHPPREVELYPDDIPLDIIYEDDVLVVVNKPAGMVVHPAYGNFRGTLVNAMVHHMYPELDGAPIKSESVRPGLVHRIDKDTAGLVIFSINPATRDAYQALFRSRTVKKTYHAIAPLSNTQQWPLQYCSRLIEDEKFFRTREVTGESNSETHILLIEKYSDSGLYQLQPVTGRKHQLRVHLSSLGVSIEGDSLYPVVKKIADGDFSQPLQLLAKTLEFIDPITGEERFFESKQMLRA